MSVVMSASTPRAMPDDWALLYVLEAYIETLKAENEILKRQLAAAETRAAQAAIMERADAPAPTSATPTAEPEPRRSWARWWFGLRAAG
jgi:hypothetical protein